MSISNKEKLPKLKYLVPSAVFLFFFTVAFYGFHFPYGLSNNQQDWGTFGDFMGGTLNPIFAIFSLAAILYTIKIQTEELELSRKELEATRDELRKSSEAQQEQSESFKIQNESIKLQSFENTFFQLMNLFLSTREQLKIKIEFDHSIASAMNHFIINSKEKYQVSRHEASIFTEGYYSSYEAVQKYLAFLKKLHRINYDEFNKKYEGHTGTYFIQIYQILKFINNSQIKNKQFYVNLLRAQFTKEELEFLFYHCLGSVGERKFKPLVEQFEFFEHLVSNKEIEKKLLHYSKNAFGKNETILSKYKEQKETMESQDGDF